MDEATKEEMKATVPNHWGLGNHGFSKLDYLTCVKCKTILTKKEWDFFKHTTIEINCDNVEVKNINWHCPSCDYVFSYYEPLDCTCGYYDEMGKIQRKYGTPQYKNIG